MGAADDTREPSRDRGFGAVPVEVNADIEGLSLVEALAAVKAERNLLRISSDALLDPQVLLEVVHDPSGQAQDLVFRHANLAFCDYLGRQRSEVLEHRLTEIFPGVVDVGVLAQYLDSALSGTPVSMDDFGYFNEVFGQLRYYDIRGRQVRPGLLSLTFRDVTERVEAGRKIAENEERYRLLLLNSADAVMHVRDGIAVWVSPAIEQVLGAPAEHWIGTRLSDVVPPDDIPAFTARWSILDAGGTVQERIRLVAVDGVIHWAHLHAGPFYDIEGRRDGTSASLRLVDDEVAAEHELDEARRAQSTADAIYSRSMDSAAVGMCLASPAGPFIRVNNALCDFFGYDAETLLTKTWIELTAPEYQDADLANVAELVAGRIETYQLEKQYIHADGHRIWGHLSVGCVRNPDGSVAMTIGQIVDITDTVEARRAVERYRQAFDGSNIGFNIVRGDGPVVWINQAMCDLYGLDVDTAMQKTWQEMTPPENLENNLRVVEDMMAGRVDAVRTIQYAFSADGQKVWLDISLKCLTGAEGKPEFIFTQMLDITERVEAQRQLAADIDSAGRYLRSILPGELSGATRVSGRYLPAEVLGGDCYDYRWITSDHLLVYLFDVSGHGLDAALLAVSVHNLLRSGSVSDAVLLQPDRVLAEVNGLFPMERNDEHYLTMWFGIYQPSTRVLRYTSAGHPPAIALTVERGHPTATDLSTNDLPVGTFPDTSFTTGTYQVPRGGQLLLYSDGLLDLAGADTDRAAGQVLAEMCTDLASRSDWSPETLINTLRPPGAGAQPDDCSLVLVHFD